MVVFFDVLYSSHHLRPAAKTKFVVESREPFSCGVECGLMIVQLFFGNVKTISVTMVRSPVQNFPDSSKCQHVLDTDAQLSFLVPNIRFGNLTNDLIRLQPLECTTLSGCTGIAFHSFPVLNAYAHWFICFFFYCILRATVTFCVA